MRRRPGGALVAVLVGLHVLSLEFAWADRLLQCAQVSGRVAWESARAEPVTSAVVTGGGLVLPGLASWVVSHDDLVAEDRDVVGRWACGRVPFALPGV